MTRSHSSTKRRSYTHLTEIEGGQVVAYSEQGLSLRDIKNKLRWDHSTISRELKQGKVEQLDTNRQSYKKYCPDAGARVYKETKKNRAAPTILMASWEFILYSEKNTERQLFTQCCCQSCKKAR